MINLDSEAVNNVFISGTITQTGPRGEKGDKGDKGEGLTEELKANYDAAYNHSIAAHAPSTAQENAIEHITLNGTELEISCKTVDIDTASGSCHEVSAPLPTVFSNDYLNEQLENYELSQREIMPKDGDKLINTDGNAVYGYRKFPDSASARVYVYQCRRDGVTLAGNGEHTGQIIGNYTGYSSNSGMKTGSGHTLSEIGTNNFYNEYNALFKNTALQMVAEFTLEDPLQTGTMAKILQFIVNNASLFPKVKLVNGGLNDALIMVRFKGKNSSSRTIANYPFLASDFIDNALAVEINGKKYFEYWAADCWYETTGGYLTSASLDSSVNKASGEENDYTIYYCEQGGGEGARIAFTNSESASSGTVYTFNNLVEVQAESGGEWVYEGPICETAFIRSIEASSDSITTASGNSALSYDTLDVNAKPGDIHIKTPSSILNLTSAQIWQCKYAVKDLQKQVWEKIF